MAATNPKTIVLKGDPPRDERKAHSGATITPGMLCEFVNESSEAKIRAQQTPAQWAAPLFAVESPYTDKDAGTPAIDVDYLGSNDDNVRYVTGQPGDVIYGWLVAGGSVDANDFLESGGTGTFQQSSGTPSHQVLAQALEDKDNGAGTVNVRLKIQLI